MNKGAVFQFQEEGFIKTSEELQKCLKRIIKSVERWSRVGGRQGYLNFTARFFPGDILRSLNAKGPAYVLNLNSG